MREFDSQIRETATERLKAIEDSLKTDAVLFFGPIVPAVKNPFRDMIENLKPDPVENPKTISVILQTLGGSAETVEKLVEILRHHYDSVNFVIPDYAMSAGTLFALSGDKIHMDYSSSLGPIDPQVPGPIDPQDHNRTWVSALGYLDQIEKIIQKSAKGKLTEADVLMIKGQDLALLNEYEQARNLTITLLKEWLAKYKFRNWTKHHPDSEKKGKEVTDNEKRKRAEEIANILSDNKIWHSHGRQIGLKTLQKVLHLEIEDYSKKPELQAKIRRYVEFLTPYLTPYVIRHGTFIQSRNWF